MNNQQVRDYQAVIKHQSRKVVGAYLLDQIIRDGLGQDLLQEERIAAWLAQRDGMNLREASNFGQRSIYRAVRNMGYARPRGERSFIKRECPIDEIEESGESYATGNH